MEGSIVCGKILAGAGNFGYNVAADTYEDLAAAGIIGPTKVIRIALRNAASVVALLLTSDAMIAERPEKEKALKKDYGGDYDMY